MTESKVTTEAGGRIVHRTPHGRVSFDEVKFRGLAARHRDACAAAVERLARARRTREKLQASEARLAEIPLHHLNRRLEKEHREELERVVASDREARDRAEAEAQTANDRSRRAGQLIQGMRDALHELGVDWRRIEGD